jgi:hypothetical protein
MDTPLIVKNAPNAEYLRAAGWPIGRSNYVQIIPFCALLFPGNLPEARDFLPEANLGARAASGVYWSE